MLLDRGEEPKKRAAALKAFMVVAPKAYSLAEAALKAYITTDIQSHMK